ncbi:MAG: hypothetical protein ACFCU4_03600 [Puniceicoccaceae bacterium]
MNIRIYAAAIASFGLGYLFAGYISDSQVTPEDLTSSSPPLAPEVVDRKLYATGYQLALDSGLDSMRWSKTECESFVAGMHDKLADLPPRVPIATADFKDIHQIIATRFESSRTDASQIPSTIAPLIEAYRKGAYSQKVQPGTLPIPSNLRAISIDFTSAIVTEKDSLGHEMSAHTIVDMDNIDVDFRRVMNLAGLNGKVVAVIPARFIKENGLLLSGIHPDQSVVYRLKFSVPDYLSESLQHLPELTHDADQSNLDAVPGNSSKGRPLDQNRIAM